MDSETKEKDEKKNNHRTLIVVLIIIILLLLFMIFFLLKNCLFGSGGSLAPTGNVDIFEIECDYNCNCVNDTETLDDEEGTLEEEKDSSVSNGSGSSSYSSGSSSNSSDFSNSVVGDVEVNDSNTKWSATNVLRIFENPAYNLEEIIAPLSTNSYQFIIRNGTSVFVVYDLEFIEQNVYDINMKFRLMKNGSYVSGSDNSWVTYDQLKVSSSSLISGSKDTYYLEWKWFESDNDTSVGSNIGAYYSLKINLSAQQKV